MNYTELTISGLVIVQEAGQHKHDQERERKRGLSHAAKDKIREWMALEAKPMAITTRLRTSEILPPQGPSQSKPSRSSFSFLLLSAPRGEREREREDNDMGKKSIMGRIAVRKFILSFFLSNNMFSVEGSEIVRVSFYQGQKPRKESIAIVTNPLEIQQVH